MPDRAENGRERSAAIVDILRAEEIHSQAELLHRLRRRGFRVTQPSVSRDFQERDSVLKSGDLVLFNDGNQIVVATEEDPVRFLLISGKPIGEPIAWYGPIVMNTREELRIAFEEYNNGTFIKQRKGKSI